jgi:hypothetical protein
MRKIMESENPIYGIYEVIPRILNLCTWIANFEVTGILIPTDAGIFLFTIMHITSGTSPSLQVKGHQSFSLQQ